MSQFASLHNEHFRWIEDDIVKIEVDPPTLKYEDTPPKPKICNPSTATTTLKQRNVKICEKIPWGPLCPTLSVSTQIKLSSHITLITCCCRCEATLGVGGVLKDRFDNNNNKNSNDVNDNINDDDNNANNDDNNNNNNTKLRPQRTHQLPPHLSDYVLS